MLYTRLEKPQNSDTENNSNDCGVKSNNTCTPSNDIKVLQR